jgi:hypothetical protein
MLKLAQETIDVADRTITALEIQKEELTRQQQEVAALNDDLNVSEKKMRAIKSGWGGLVNLPGYITSTKTNHEHTKGLKKWEDQKERTKQEQLAQDQKLAYEQGKINVKENAKFIGETTGDLADEQHLAKKSSKMEAKGITKGHVDQRDGTVNYGGFIFEERIEGTGPKHQAEQDLELLSQHTQQLRHRANVTADLTRYTCDQIDYINAGVENANSRSANLNNNMTKYVKKG